MTNEEKINRLRNIQRCTPIHTREDSRDFEALEAAIEDIEELDWIKSTFGKELEELEEESIAKNRLMAVSGMSIEELTDAFTKGYRLVGPDGMRVTRVTIDEAYEAIQKLTTGAGISQEDIESSDFPVYDLAIDEVISRQQALKELKESAEHHANDSREEVLLRRDRDIIRALPPVTPQEKIGHWIAVGDYFWKCSECRCCEIKKSDWCPSCGAMMQEVEE